MVNFLIFLITRLATGDGSSLIYESLLGVLYEVKKEQLVWIPCMSVYDLVAVTKGFVRFSLSVM
jgi:hypothetical protein